MCSCEGMHWSHMHTTLQKERAPLASCTLTAFIPLFSGSAGKDGCVPWLVNELGNLSTHWCTRAELAAVLGSLARIPALSAAMVSPCVENYVSALRGYD